MTTFCKFLSNGLVYNNNTTSFTISPCCYYSKVNQLDVLGDHSEQITHYRKSWLQDDFKQTCKLCLDMESAGLHSYRQSSFDIITNSDKIEILTVAVNKQCNLACPSCGPHSSSFWYQENIRNNILQPPVMHLFHQQHREKNSTEKFVEILTKLDLTQLRYIKFGGGEPLMSDVHLEIMKIIPNPSQVTVQYTSNFTIMPSTKILDQWQKFKLIKWMASLDGVDAQFEFLRWPATWSLIQHNIKQGLATVPGNVMFGVEHTLNPLNIYYYDRFKQWFDVCFKTNRHGDLSDFNLHTCTGVMDISNTPPAVRDMVSAKYGPTHELVKILRDHAWSGTTRLLTEYLDKVAESRDQNWRQTFVEIQEHFQ